MVSPPATGIANVVATIDTRAANPVPRVLVDPGSATQNFGFRDVWRGLVAINDAGQIAVEGTLARGDRAILLFTPGVALPRTLLAVGGSVTVPGDTGAITARVLSFEWRGRHAFNESAEIAVKIELEGVGTRIVRITP